MLVEVMVMQVEAVAEFQSKFSVGMMSPQFMSTVRFYAFAGSQMPSDYICITKRAHKCQVIMQFELSENCISSN